MSEPIVRVSHIRSCGHCMGGARAWFERYGFDWSAFLQDGLPASEIEATGDAFGIAVARHAREEATWAA